jgi:tetratricopeptide (TPR) repeat protein
MSQFHYRYSIAATLLALSAIWIYESRVEGGDSPARQPVRMSSAPTFPTLSGSYLASRHANMYGDSKSASQYLSYALSYAPQDKELTSQAVRSLLLSGDIDGAVKLAREKTALEVKTPAIHLTLFTEEARHGNWELAASHLDNIKAYGLQAVTLPFLQSWVKLAEEGKVLPPESTLKLKHSYYDAFLNYQTALLHDVAGNAEKASEYYDLMLTDVALVPERFIEIALQFYVRQGNRERAREIYNAFQEASGVSLSAPTASFDKAYDRIAITKDKPIIATPQDGIAEVMLSMSNLLHSEMVEREAMVYARLALAIRPDFPDALFTLAEIQEASKKPLDALESYSSISKDNPLYRRASLRRAFLLDESNQSEQAITLLQEMARTMPEPIDIHMTLADILRNKNKYKEAAAHYSKAIDALGTVKPRHWPLFYTRGISYERAGEWEKAEEDLLRALSLEPDQPDVKNYLAYSWLLMGKNLAKATEMLEQASASRPEDGHILDSLAWAYHITGKDDRALTMIERAVEIMPHDPTVNDHYGDILWKTGRRTEARFQWERALAFDPEPKDRAAIEKKLASGLPSPLKENMTSTASSNDGAIVSSHP